MKNPDRQNNRRREVGNSPEGEDDPDGREVARALYGELDEHEPTEEEDGTTQ